jgi:hypothetical protein
MRGRGIPLRSPVSAHRGLYVRNAVTWRHFAGGPLQYALETDWLAEDAVHCEPVSAPKFPANREINREFCRFAPRSAILAFT